jgi:hypothetical protein
MNNYLYYVYAYVRESNGVPYYIGKGKGQRAYQPHSPATTPKDRSKIIFLETNLSEIGAFALERRYIKWFGRKCNNDGVLVNIADGGQGSAGMIVSPERKKHQSLVATNMWKTKREKMRKGQVKGCMASFGFESPMHNPDIRQKSLNTLKSKYNITNISQREDIKSIKAAGQREKSNRPIVKTIKALNGYQRFTVVPLGKGWYTKSDEWLEAKLKKIVSILLIFGTLGSDQDA